MGNIQSFPSGNSKEIMTKLDSIYKAISRRTTLTWDTDTDFSAFNEGTNYLTPHISLVENLSTVTSGLTTTIEAFARWYIDADGTSGTYIFATEEMYDFTDVDTIDATYSYQTGSSGRFQILLSPSRTDLTNATVVREHFDGYDNSQVLRPIDVSTVTGKQYIIIKLYTVYTSNNIRIDIRQLRFDAYESELTKTNNAITLSSSTTSTTKYIKSSAYTKTSSSVIDMIDFHIESYGGSYRIAIINPLDDTVLLSDVSAGQDISELKDYPYLSVGIHLERPTTTDQSPEIKSVSLSYID